MRNALQAQERLSFCSLFRASRTERPAETGRSFSSQPANHCPGNPTSALPHSCIYAVPILLPPTQR